MVAVFDQCNDDGSTSSADTNEAFLEMLGLPAFDCVSAMTETENDCNGDDVVVTSSIHKTYEESSRVTMPTNNVARLEVPHRCSRYLHQPSDVAAFVIDNFLDATECQELIHLASQLASPIYVTEAAHTDNEGITHIVKLQDANKHKLSVFEHAPTLDKLWKKMKPTVLPHIGSFINNTNCGPPLGLNPRLRVLRYDATDNDVFEPHFDATTKVGDNMTSLLTVLIYLNDGGGDDFDGGETCYIDHMSPKNIEAATKITPATGKVVVFEHDCFHSSVPLQFGTKYVLRTDILFELDTENGGVDKPRGSTCKSETESTACTLLELCQHLNLSEESKLALDEIGMLDLTLDSMFAPGVSAVKQMLCDVLDKQSAERLMKAALHSR